MNEKIVELKEWSDKNVDTNEGFDDELLEKQFELEEMINEEDFEMNCEWSCYSPQVTILVNDEELESRVMAMATDIANGPQVAQRLLKRSVYNAADMIFEHSLDEIAAKTAISDHHADAREGALAFREKRTPRFNAWLEK